MSKFATLLPRHFSHFSIHVNQHPFIIWPSLKVRVPIDMSAKPSACLCLRRLYMWTISFASV